MMEHCTSSSSSDNGKIEQINEQINERQKKLSDLVDEKLKLLYFFQRVSIELEERGYSNHYYRYYCEYECWYFEITDDATPHWSCNFPLKNFETGIYEYSTIMMSSFIKDKIRFKFPDHAALSLFNWEKCYNVDLSKNVQESQVSPVKTIRKQYPALITMMCWRKAQRRSKASFNPYWMNKDCFREIAKAIYKVCA